MRHAIAPLDQKGNNENQKGDKRNREIRETKVGTLNEIDFRFNKYTSQSSFKLDFFKL